MSVEGLSQKMFNTTTILNKAIEATRELAIIQHLPSFFPLKVGDYVF